ncbi:MAG: uroporphyrinogen-III C-methyltransferase [Deltaproteobacteria bacterium]|nr:uroporphyrinogen-III C-methyltransferase [Deltaproteobacteria bacterium]
MKGTVYLVGAGPGPADLITLRGAECLRRADVVVYDFLAERALALASERAERICVGKRAGAHCLPQAEINRLLVTLALEGKQVVRLKGGDPFIFGRGGEEADALVEAGIPFDVVPGVTSAVAVPGAAGIPLTDRRCSSSVAFVTGHEDPTREGSRIAWDRLATGVDTLVFLMGVRTLPAIVRQLLLHGRAPKTPGAVIASGTRSDETVVTGTLETILEEVARHPISPPAITVVGRVVALRERLGRVARARSGGPVAAVAGRSRGRPVRTRAGRGWPTGPRTLREGSALEHTTARRIGGARKAPHAGG